MLRCKINSANETAPGGPVSNADAGIAIFGEVAMTASPKLIRSSVKVLGAKPFAIAGARARKILQQGESLDSFFFAGADCLE